MQINNLRFECSLGQSSRRVRMSFLFSQDELLVCNKSSESCNNELLIGSERCITCAELGRFEFRSLLAPNQISKSSWACKTQGQPPSIYIIERHFEHQNFHRTRLHLQPAPCAQPGDSWSPVVCKPVWAFTPPIHQSMRA